MKNLSVKKIIEYTKGIPYNCEKILEEEVTNVTIDSRKIEKGGLFIAIKGARVDGHDLIPQVIEGGALLALSEVELEGAKFPYIKVESTNMALQDVARLYREGLKCKIVGISGSVGKTSTKEMVYSILSEKFKTLKTEGNFNNEIGVPLTLFRITEDIEVAIIEMGINHFGEMTRLAKMARPDICILTNIGDCHLEFLGDRPGVYKAKSEMFALRNSEKSPIILNGDDEILSKVKEFEQVKTLHFSKDCKENTQLENEAWATEIEDLGLEGIKCKLNIKNKINVCSADNNTDSNDFESIELTIPVPGIHMVSNMLAGALAGTLLGMSIDEIKSGVQKSSALKGRGRIVKGNGYKVFDDCYNANPVSMKASLDVLESANGRKIAVLGDMGELGENEAELHKGVGEYAATKKIDMCIFIGPLSKSANEGFEEKIKLGNKNGISNYYFQTKEEFINNCENIIKKDDIILVKASHYMGFEDIIEKLTCELK